MIECNLSSVCLFVCLFVCSLVFCFVLFLFIFIQLPWKCGWQDLKDKFRDAGTRLAKVLVQI